MAKPLTWCIDWAHLKPMERIMMWIPAIGTQRRIYADLIRQLKSRDPDDQSAWEKYPQAARDLAAQVSRILIQQLGWPENALFLPDDPADIMFWDKTGDLAGVEAILAVEKAIGREMGDGFWERLPEMTFSQVVEKMEHARDSRPIKSASKKGHGHSAVVVCALALSALCGCRIHGEKITVTVKEDRILPVAEFRTLFAESNLNSKCYWYFGNKDGYACIEIDTSNAIDEYDDVLNRRQHHTLMRYRVAETDVEFIPRIDFVGWDGYGGKRITEFRKDVPEGMAVYRIKSQTSGAR